MATYYNPKNKKVTATNAGNGPNAYKSTNIAPTYKNTAKAPADYKVGTYNSQYAKQLDAALNTVTNWKYDPMKDASYQALAKVYGARGNTAAKNSLADAAALNGGYGTSYAVSAAQQARNQYNQELAALIPDLESMAYTRAAGTLSALREADDTAYGRFRDTESDRQWKYSQDYQKYRDLTSDNQWKYTQDYQKYRDKEADAQWAWTQQYNKYRDLASDWQWAVNYNYGVDRNNASDSQWLQNFSYQQQRDAIADSQWAQEFALKKSDAIGGGGSGGGGGGRSGGGGGSSSGGGGGDYSGVSSQISSAKKKTKKSSSDPIVKGAMATRNIAKAALRKRKGNGGR